MLWTNSALHLAVNGQSCEVVKLFVEGGGCCCAAATVILPDDDDNVVTQRFV